MIFDPAKRINCKTSLEHSYFDQVVTRHDTHQSSVTKRDNQDKNNNSASKHQVKNNSVAADDVVLNNSSQTEKPCCSKQGECDDRSFPRVDSGLGIDVHEVSGCDDRRYFSRSDSGICVSPPTVDSSTSNDTIATDNECYEKNRPDFSCAKETNLLIRERNTDVGSEDDLLKSPPRKMIRKEK